MGEKYKNEIARLVIVCIAVLFLIVPAMAATTELTITKYANDGTTILNQTTKNYTWLEANLPVKGDGSTHYFHQGPTFNDSDPYDPAEWQNVESRDFGAVKGTDVKDLCGLVGEAHTGDMVKIKAADGLTLTYPYEYIYTPDPRQGPMVIAWYNGEESNGGYENQGTGYPPSYFKGMRLIMFADTSTNHWGYHVFGNNDMLQVWAPQYRYNFSTIWPSSGGISEYAVRYINIMSQDPVPVVPTAAFSGTPVSGNAPLTVQFTDASSGSITGYAWDFNNDGTTDSTAQSPSHQYSTAGTYTVKLTVTGPGGSDDETKTNYISVSSPPAAPVAVFSGTPLTGNAPLTVQFTDASTGSITGYAWDFNNDGTTDSTSQSPSYEYTTAGTYTVKLTVTGPGGSDEETKTGYITANAVIPAPVAAFSGTPQSGNAPLTVQFTDASTGSITGYAWDFNNDGTTDSTAQSPSYQYTTAGTYTVKLTVTGPGGSDDETRTNYITVNEVIPAPVAVFSGTPLTGNAPLTVQFTDASTGSITGYAWDFNNDGTTDSTAQSPSYQYTAAGTYTVKLTVTGPVGSDDETKVDYITVTSAPVVDTLFDGSVTLTPDTKFTLVPYNNLSTSYQVNSTTPLGALDSVNKSLGIRVDVTDKSYSTKNILMVDNIGAYMYSKVSGITHTWICQVNGVTLDDFNAPSTDGLNLKSLVNGDQVNFYYGMKPVTPDNATAVVKMSVNIPSVAAPVAVFSGTPVSGTAPLTVQFTDASTGTPTSWAWDFTNDGTVDSADPSPSHIYDTAGTYTVNLTVTNAGGSDSEVKTDYITVTAAGPKTWYVHTSQELLQALTDASDGDTVFLYNGIYDQVNNYMFLVSVPNLTITGESRDGVIIRVNGEILRVGLRGNTIDGYTSTPAPNCLIENITMTILTAGQSPKGITVEANSPNCTIRNVNSDQLTYRPVTIIAENCRILDSIFRNTTGPSSASTYSAIYIFNKTNTVSGCIFEDNANRAADIYLRNAQNSVIENNIFQNNTDPSGTSSVIYARDSPDIRIRNNRFIDNTKSGTVYIYGTTSNIEVNNCSFSGNNVIFTFNNAGNNNRFYLNNFMNYSNIVTISGTAPATTYWTSAGPVDYTYNGGSHSEVLGNYWDTYAGSDADNNGIGDTPFEVNSSLGSDTAPLMGSWMNGEITYTPPAVITPVAAFTSDIQTGTAPLTVNFTDQSTNTPTSWAWDINNDGTVDYTTKNATHIFTTAGNYTVNLTVTNAGGNDSEVKTDYITVNAIGPKTWYVHNGESIGTAIANAGDGDTVYVYSGTYAPFDIYGKTDLRVQGEGADVVIIDAAGGNMHIWNGGGGHVFEGFTVKNTGDGDYGFMISESDCIIRNCIFDYMPGLFSVFIEGVHNVTFENNVMSNSGGFVVALGSGEGSCYDEIIRGNVFSNLTETGSPVVSIQGAPNTIFENNIILDSLSDAGTFGIEGDHCIIANNTITNNVRQEENNVNFATGESLIIFNNTITNNSGLGLGLIGTPNSIVTNNNISSNTAGLSLYNAGEENRIYLNNIAGNVVNVPVNLWEGSTPPAVTYWNSTSPVAYTYNSATYTDFPGNYWGNDYSGTDADGNGIGDTSFTVPDGLGDDYRPLMGAWKNGEITYTPPVVIAPVAAFTSDVQTGTAPLTVNFTDQSTNTPTSWAWDVNNDGTVEYTTQNATHIFTTAGNYTVNLTATNAGGSDSEVKTDYITVNASPVTPALLWGPYLTGTTTTGTVVNVKTNITTAVIVEYATDAYYTANSAYDQSATDSVSTQLHHVSLAGLTPDTLYHYRVVYDGQATGDLHFSTFPASGAFTFVMYSDTQDQLPTYSQLERHKLVADRIAEEPDVAFVLNSGDLVNDASDLANWDRYFAAGSMMMANTTVYPALGNHDNNDPNYYQNYGVPEYYSFDCGDGHVSVLDSNDWAWNDLPVQSAWLANDLQTDKPFKFTSFHHPLYTSEAKHFGGWENLKLEWEDEINDNGVLAVFNGHVHAYERFLVNDTNYFVAGIGGGPSYNLATPRYTGSQNSLEYMIGYIRVTVDPAAGTATAQVIRVADVLPDNSVSTYPPGTVFETVIMNLAAAPVANFTATPLTGTAPLAVQFTDTSTGTPISWAWDFNNDGITDNTTQSPSYTYATAGTFTVNLTVTNAKGSDSEVKTGYISVSATPAITELFNGTVTLTPGETFTKQAYNNVTGIYTVNRTTPLGALDIAASTAGFTYDVTDKNYETSGLLLDNIGTYLYQKTPRKSWYAYVNDVYKDGYNNKPNALNVIELSDGDRVEFYYVNGTVADATNLAAVKANASAAVKIVADTTPGPTMDVLFDGTVMLTPGETFTKVAYNSGTSYTINRTTPLGALNVAANTAGFTYDVTDKNYETSGLLLDNIGTYLYQKTPRKAWYAYVNDVYKDGYNNKPNALNVIELSDGDRVEFYYVNGTVADATNLAAVKANASAAVKTVASTGVTPTDWSIVLNGAKTQTVTKTYFEQGLACPSSGHLVNWTDTDGNVWSGVPLWLLVGMIDDNPDLGPDHFNFNDSIAAQGYSVKVSSGDNWNTTLASADIARNDGYIVANTLNGEPLPMNLTSGKLSWPLHLKGSAVFGGQQVGNITKIELTGLPQPPAGWTLTLQGDVTEVITQSYFEEAIACHHNVTWTDTSGNTWEGVSLWDLAGVVDDFETTSHYTFNDTRATMGYTIRVSAGNGFNATFASADVAHNDGYFLAHKMNGVALTGSAAPLRLVGPSTTSGSQRIGNVVKISLEGLPDQYPAGDWQLTLNGKIIDVIPQGEFEYWALHHPATYTDTNGNVYTGIPLWRLMGWVDDQIPHGSNGFNDAAATAGYTVIVKAGDGYAKEFTSQSIGKNDNFIIANTMNGTSLPTDGSKPPYPLRLVGSGATGGNSVGNIVEIQLTDFLTPVEAPKLHIVKYGSDGTTIINETTIDYHYMEDNLQVIGDGVTHYQYQGVTFDPTDLWDPTETQGMNPPKIDNAIKGTKVKDLVELVGGMGTGTDIIFVASDGYETVMGYSNIYTNPYVQSHQGDAVLAWYADGQYVPQYGDGMRFMFTPEDHVFGQWDMHEAMDQKYWHYYWSDNIQYPSAAGTSAKYITEIKIYSSPESDWQLELDGSDIGGIKTNISKTYLEQALACQFGSEHKATYTDSKGNVWEGMPLWFFAGFVDDADQHSNNAFNDSLATAGYRVVITAGDGYNTTIDSILIGRNSNYIVANSLNGSHIAETDSNWPLRLTGVNVTGGSAVKNINSIRLVKNLPMVPNANFSSDVQTGTIPLKVNFTDLSTGLGPLTYAWDFDNDGLTDDTTQNPSYTYATAGTYTVNLTVTNAAGADSEVKTDYITVTLPSPEFSLLLTGDHTVTLTRAEIESIVASGQNVTYTDTTNGRTWNGIPLWYLVSAVDDSDTGFNFNDTRAAMNYLVQIRASDGFAKNFTSSTIAGSSNYIIANTLNGSAIPFTDPSNPAKLWWPLKHVGSSVSGGNSVGNITEIRLIGLPVSPVADFTATPLAGIAPLTVQFTDISTGTPTSWAWDFTNDGMVDSTVQSPSHIYDTAGTYTVNLTVTNAGGSDSEVKTGYITVTAAPVLPVAAFTSDVQTGTAPLTVQFTDASTGTPTSWAWDFTNDGMVDSTVQSPSHIYDTAGTYSVNLTVTNAGGSDSEVKTGYITVTAVPVSPVAAFSSDVQTGAAPLTVQFTDASTGTPTSWAWDFTNDGIVDSTVQSPSHIYDTAGTYTVNLTVTNAGGSDSEVKTGYITVTAVPVAPVAAFSSDVQTGTSPLRVTFTDESTGSPTSWYWTFGDGTSSTNKNPVVHTYYTTGKKTQTYTVSLTVTNAKGTNKITKTRFITVTPPPMPDAAFTTNVTSGKSPLVVQFTDQSTGSPTSWRWSFGDGTTSKEQNPVHHYYTTGKKTQTYTVSLTVANSRGNDEITRKQYITVIPTPVAPVAAFTSDKKTGSAPLTVRFTDKSTGTGPLTYAWDFNNDGTVDSTQKSPTYTYRSMGTYTVKLVVTGPGGTDAEVKTGYIIVKAAPVKPAANFTSDVQSGQSPLKVTFTDESTGSPTFWLWTFGDGTSSTKQNPVHTYYTTGKKTQTYTVTLKVTNAKGIDTLTKTRYITVTPAPVPPVASFTSDKHTGSAPLTVRFTDQSTGTGPLTYAWDFNNDGTVDSTLKSPTNVYSSPGSYAVKLVVTGPGGTDAEVKTGYILVKAAPVKPAANFTSDVQSGQSPLRVTFTDESTGSPTSWYWSFGDGTSSTNKNPVVHTYYTTGKKTQTYTVTLKVTNAKGTDTKTSYITVTPKPSLEARFIANVTSGRTPLAVQFTDQSTEHPTSWYWTFGDGTSSRQQNPVHTYRSLKDEQSYTVTLRVSNSKDYDALTKTSFIKIVNNPPITILLE